MTRKRSKAWTLIYTAGERGYKVSVVQRDRSPNFYLRYWDRPKKTWCAESLGHANLTEAKKEAHRMATAFLHELDEAGDASPEVIFTRYEREHTPYKSANEQKADRRRMDLWQRVLGGMEPRQIDVAVLNRFVDERRAGRIRGLKAVKARTVEADIRWLSSVFRWASSISGSGRGKLLTSNPIDGYKNKKLVEPNPHRPLASWDGFLRVYRYADRVDPQHLLRWLLLLSEALGWRISALCQLRAKDIDLSPRASAPYGRFKKDPQLDKDTIFEVVSEPRKLREIRRGSAG